MTDTHTSLRMAEIPTDDERAQQHLRDERDYARTHRLNSTAFVLQCICSCALGLFFVGYAMHTTDMRWARVSFWGGL